MDKLGIGIIGCGNISAAYLRLAPLFKGLEVRAVADPSGAAVASSTAAGHPHLVIAGAAYPLVRDTTVLGRGSDVDIRVEDPGVSRRHCAIVLGDPALVRDLSSTNGTFVNGERIDELVLGDGMQVQIGGTVIAFRSA